MQTTQPTAQDIVRWKQLYAKYQPRLKPNRISGTELYAYLESRYPLLPREDARAKRVVIANILENDCFASALPSGTSPDPVCCTIARAGSGEALYRAQEEVFSDCDIFVGIDLVSGYFLVECSGLLWDELYAQRGLTETDLSNYYSVAEYISCLKRFNLLEQALVQ